MTFWRTYWQTTIETFKQLADDSAITGRNIVWCIAIHTRKSRKKLVVLQFLHLFQKGEIFQPSWILPNMFLHFLLRDLCMCMINSASALKSPPTNRHPLTSLSQITVRCKVILRSTAVLLVRAMSIRQWRHWTSIWGSKKRP